MISDYYLIKRGNLINKDIYSLEKNGSYYFSAGWHIKGIYSLLLGFIFSASTIWNSDLMFLQSYAWIIGAFISSITYYLLAISRPKPWAPPVITAVLFSKLKEILSIILILC